MVSVIVGYSLWQLRTIIDGPTVTVDSPKAGELTTEPRLTISGEAHQIDWLFLNNRQIFTDESGHFDEVVFASPGYNMVQLQGRDKFGRVTIKNIELVYQASSTTAL